MWIVLLGALGLGLGIAWRLNSFDLSDPTQFDLDIFDGHNPFVKKPMPKLEEVQFLLHTGYKAIIQADPPFSVSVDGFDKGVNGLAALNELLASKKDDHKIWPSVKDTLVKLQPLERQLAGIRHDLYDLNTTHITHIDELHNRISYITKELDKRISKGDSYAYDTEARTKVLIPSARRWLLHDTGTVLDLIMKTTKKELTLVHGIHQEIGAAHKAFIQAAEYAARKNQALRINVKSDYGTIRHRDVLPKLYEAVAPVSLFTAQPAADLQDLQKHLNELSAVVFLHMNDLSKMVEGFAKLLNEAPKWSPFDNELENQHQALVGVVRWLEKAREAIEKANRTGRYALVGWHATR
jgi:hypothetical protein